MAFSQKTSWYVQYGKSVLDDSFDSISFMDRADGGWSLASHVSKPLGRNADVWIDRFSEILRAGGELKFKISDTAKSVALPVQNHIIVGSRIRRRKTTLRFEFVSVEKRALMLSKPLMKHYEGEVAEIASKVITESGLKLGLVEGTKSPEEFKVLHCPGWSAHEFVNRHLVKRAVNNKGDGGYCLFSSNGDQVSFCTPRSIRSTISPDVDQVIDSVESSAVLSFAEGGGKETALGFDFESLEPLVSSGGSTPGKEFGETPLSGTESKGIYAALKGDALNIFASTSNAFAAWRRGYTMVTLFGDRNCGVDLPAKINLSQQFFPEAQGMVAVARLHSIRKGNFTCCHFAVPST